MRYNKNMLFKSMRSKLTLFLLIFIFPFVSLSADSFIDNVHFAGMASIFVFPTNNGVDADPMPILPSVGFSAAWQYNWFLRLELTEDIYMHNYEYNWARAYPMACNPENRAALVIGFLTAAQVTGVFPITQKGIQARIFGGLTADIRIVTVAAGLNHPNDFQGGEFDAKNQTKEIKNYFWGSGRWLMPTAGFGMDFPITEKYLLGFDLRAWFPIYKVWTNDNAPSIDGWRFGVGFRVTPRKAAPNAVRRGAGQNDADTDTYDMYEEAEDKDAAQD